jgi:hypothetical protein
MRLRLFSEPGSGKSELDYETAIFFNGRTHRETGQIGSRGSRSDAAEASVNVTTPAPRATVFDLEDLDNLTFLGRRRLFFWRSWD